MQVKLKLFFKWGIQFEDKPYIVPLRDNQTIRYASKDALMLAVTEKYSPKKKNEEVEDDDTIPSGSYLAEQSVSERNYAESKKSIHAEQNHHSSLGSTLITEKTE